MWSVSFWFDAAGSAFEDRALTRAVTAERAMASLLTGGGARYFPAGDDGPACVAFQTGPFKGRPTRPQAGNAPDARAWPVAFD